MTYPQRMEKERSKITDRILNLTLDIIYLLTGENYIAFKLSDGLVASNLMKTQNPVLEPPSHSLRQKKKKVKEVTSEIIELLTGEVPIRCQDVTVYFSMEEWEYLEGHKDLYKDVMMEEHQTLTSPDRSSNGNPPERCPHPLYSWDSTQEDQEIPHHHQSEIAINNKEKDIEGEDTHMNGDEPCMEQEISSKISTDGGEIRKTIVGHFFLSSDCELEDTNVSLNSTRKNTNNLDGFQDPEGASSNNLDTVSSYAIPDCFSARETPEPCSPDGDSMTLYPSFAGNHKLYPCSDCGKTFVLQHIFGEPQRTEMEQFTCCECQKRSTPKPELGKQTKGKDRVKMFACSECGKRFSRRCYLYHHESIHAGNCEYQCSECGKCFTNKSNLVVHYRSHTGEKPYSCTECGKCFTHRSTLVKHLRIHTGERPYSCFYCGKGFAQKSGIDRHQRIHMKEVSTIII
ncbi:oocyte zinc finger protein XlCOF7.1-like isoform X3 [Pyxicephalus adspersus]|uniref:oocyte zinc finger protein XlCOF7.1-like isoform X3 n=1 Tax=Pyxicephalus adspersus TaxID=30357 RepID=UPI003B5C163F